MESETVSVVVPTYNRPKELNRALNSVIEQTYKELEIIVIDDCSVTNTKRVIDRFDDDRIVLITHEKNRGPQVARNNGIRKSSGEYIALLDDDDEWFQKKIEKQVRKIRNNPNTGIVYCGADCVRSDDGKVIQVKRPELRGDVSQKIFKSCPLMSATPLIRSDLFSEFDLFDETLPSCQDWDMWIRMSEKCEFDYVDEILARIFIHGDQISFDYQKRIKGREMLLYKHLQRIESSGYLAEYYHWLGVNYFLYSDPKKGREYEAKACEIDSNMRYRLTRILFNIGPSLFRSFLKITGRLYEV